MNTAILEALEAAERVLAGQWKLETLSFVAHHRDMVNRPDLMAKILDPWGGHIYPTADALHKVREAIKAVQS